MGIESLIPIATGLLTAGGSALTSGMNYQSVKETNAQNLALQQQQWAREDTSVQRRVKDLEAAGLNPVLAAGGSGEPSSLTTKIQAPLVSDNNIIGKGIQAALVSQQMARTQADTDIARENARAAKVAADIAEAGEAGQKAYAFNKGYADASILNNQSLISDYNKLTAANQAKKAEIDANVAAHDWDILQKSGMLSNASGQAGQIENISAMIMNAINSIKAKGGISYLLKEK